jgi:hypothetical protein
MYGEMYKRMHEQRVTKYKELVEDRLYDIQQKKIV